MQHVNAVGDGHPQPTTAAHKLLAFTPARKYEPQGLYMARLRDKSSASEWRAGSHSRV